MKRCFLFAVPFGILIPAFSLGQISFDAGTNYAAAGGPGGLAVADFNGDTWNDVAVGCSIAGQVAVLINDQSGGFNAPALYTAADATAIVAADFDGINGPDVATVNGLTDQVLVLLNDGTGALGPAVSYTGNGTPNDIFVGTLDANSSPDIAVASFGVFPNELDVFLNSGSGTFPSATDYPSTGPVGIGGGLINADSDIDLVMALLFDDQIEVYFNNGSGGFSSSSTFAVGNGPHDATVAQIDGVGGNDIAVPLLFDNQIAVLLSTGPGTFGTPTNYAAGSEPNDVLAVDLTGDGLPELISANDGTVSPSEYIRILPNDGSGGFSGTPVDLNVPTGVVEVVADDFDKDGDIDLVTANEDGSNVTLFSNQEITRVHEWSMLD